MKKGATMKEIALACVLILTVSVQAASGQSSSDHAVPVGVDNFIRAESDLYFRGILKDSGAIGKFLHRREPARIDNQTVIRLNRDTLYSSAVFDLDAGPVTITLPEAGKRFMSMQVISEDHYVPEVVYGKGSYALTREKVGTRYAAVAIRTLVDPVDPRDIEQVHVLQDEIKVDQAAGGKFRHRTGIRPARRRCATRCWSLPPPFRTSQRHSAPKSRSIRSAI